MIRLLVDSSAVWRLLRDPQSIDEWSQAVEIGAIGSCEPERAEFRRSARTIDELHQMNRMFDDLYPDVPVPKTVWRWIEAAQDRLAGIGATRALSVVDLLICGTAAARGLTVLHDDADYELALRHLPDVDARRIRLSD